MTTITTDDRIEVTSASAEEVLGSVAAAREQDVDEAVDAARRVLPEWSALDRAPFLESFAAALEARADEIARLVSAQNGMPIRISRATEATVPATMLRYYAKLAADLGTEEERASLVSGTTIVCREPVGVVGAIVPWNFPQTLAFFKLAPALAAGCTVVLKPSSETVLDAMIVAEAAIEAGLPPGVLSIVPGSGRSVGARLVSHPGSTRSRSRARPRLGERSPRRAGACCGRSRSSSAASRRGSSSTTATSGRR